MKNKIAVSNLNLIIALLSAALLLGACGDRPTGPDNSKPALPGPPARSIEVQSFADIVQKVSPAVVTVRSERLVRPARPFPFFNDPTFRDLFGLGDRPSRPQLERGLGSGVIVTGDGYIITNHHVIDGADEIKIEMGEGKIVDAKIIGSDPPSDIAVLKVSSGGLTALPLGNSDQVRVGDIVLAIGNPLGIGQTVTAGIISAKERTTGLGQGSFESFLQTDAPINKGNSGGALVNTAGELIGINSQILSTSGTGGSIGIGFAIPSNMARQVSEQLIKSGQVRRGRLGVTIQSLSGDLAKSLNIENQTGVVINSVEPGSPAERAGIRQLDAITELNGKKIEDSNHFRNRIAALAPGTEVALTVIREGKKQIIKAKLGELSAEAGSQNPSNRREDEEERLGLSLTPLTPDLAERLDLEKNAQGLVVTDVYPASPAAKAGIQAGDWIKQANRRPIRTIEDLKQAIESAGNRPILLLIQREGSSFYVALSR